MYSRALGSRVACAAYVLPYSHTFRNAVQRAKWGHGSATLAPFARCFAAKATLKLQDAEAAAASAKTPKRIARFFKVATVKPAPDSRQDGWTVSLDGRVVKTKLKRTLLLPTETLAMMVANEWDAQHPTIRPHTMHMMGIASTVTDLPAKEILDPTEPVQKMLEYFETDTVCFPVDEPEKLQELQDEHWTPLIEWFARDFGVSVEDVGISRSLAPPAHSERLRGKMTDWCRALTPWQRICVADLIRTTKSFIVAYALARRHIDAERAVFVSTLETVFQVQGWGAVLDSHDVDEHDLRGRIASASLFLHLLEEV